MGISRPNTRQRVQAFTLIELLVVITIVGVLIALLMPAISKARDEARITVCLSQEHQLYVAVRAFTNDRKDAPPVNSNSGNTASFDALMGLTGDPFSSSDPYRWIYTGIAQVWASGYFNSPQLMICPGLVNYVDEVAEGFQTLNVVQPNGPTQLGRLLPMGQTINGIVSAGPGAGYLSGGYSVSFADPDIYAWPATQVKRFPMDKYPNNALMMCSQSVYNFQQTPSMPWYLRHHWDSHNRENMNCMYGDGMGRRLRGVGEYAKQVYEVSDWTWQICATDDPYGIAYWWPWANSQR